MRWLPDLPRRLLSKQHSIPSAGFKALQRAMIQKQFYGLGLPARMRSSRNALISSSKSGQKPAKRIPHTLMQEMRITPEFACLS